MLCFSVVSIRSFELEALPQKNKNNNRETAQRYLLLGCSLTQFTQTFNFSRDVSFIHQKQGTKQNYTTKTKLSHLGLSSDLHMCHILHA